MKSGTKVTCVHSGQIAHFDGDEHTTLPHVDEFIQEGHQYTVQTFAPKNANFSFDRIYLLEIPGMGFHASRFR